MVNENFRNAIFNYCAEHGLTEDEQPLIFDNHAYDNSVIGISHDGRLVYDYELMVQEFMKDENCSEEEAVEWIEYNTMRSLCYGGGLTPIIITTNYDYLMEIYNYKNYNKQEEK